MKKYELSDLQLKLATLLAVAIIGWFCLKGAGVAYAQYMPANLPHGAHSVHAPNGL
ncbi:MAG TPA: hypothetical protein VGR14_18440 [Verrucomicrobiae bacterium]|jgi:hypothetical protein|nr:hypothetical protein [Verrucomicrobiae bacterium]